MANNKLNPMKEIKVSKITLNIGAGKNEDLLKKGLKLLQKLSPKNFDMEGNFAFGIPEYIEIEGLEYDPELKIIGLEVAVTLERRGFRIKHRKIKAKEVGKAHRLNKEESIAFMQKKLGVTIQ